VRKYTTFSESAAIKLKAMSTDIVGGLTRQKVFKAVMLCNAGTASSLLFVQPQSLIK